VLPLPEPMLARSGPLPKLAGWRFEPKLPELSGALPRDVQLDGELIAWGDDGTPDSHRLGRRMLHGDASIPVTYMVFDVLALDGEPTLRLPYLERHALLEELLVEGPPALVEIVASFEDGLALWDAVVARGLEGLVAKRATEPYRPGARLWVKTKNRATARFQEERTGAQGRRR